MWYNLTAIGNSSITVEHQLFTKSDGKLVANGQGIIVCADPVAQKSVKIPEIIRELISKQL